MEYGDLFKSGAGAVIGFALAQVVNIAKVSVEWVRRPKLKIETVGENHILLAHLAETEQEPMEEIVYGFYVHNVGRRIATNTRFQIIKIEIRGKNDSSFSVVCNAALDLSTYINPYRKGSKEATVVPGATVQIELAGYRENYEVIFPATDSIPEYYEEACSGSFEYRFEVVAFAENASFVKKQVTVRRS
jgi:hypothetical protein